MPVPSNSDGPSTERRPSFGLGSFLFALFFTLLVYLLISSMERHNFFRGGHPHRPTTSLTEMQLCCQSHLQRIMPARVLSRRVK
jgi:hypothetical protein